MIVGELRIPFYSEPECVNKVKEWRIPIVDRQKALEYGMSKYITETSGGSVYDRYNSGLNYESDGENSKRVRYTTISGDWGTANNQRVVTAAQVGIMTFLMTSAASYAPTENTYKNYTMVGVFDTIGTFYMKNGNYAVVREDIRSEGLLGHNVKYWVIQFYNSRGTSIDLGFSEISDFMGGPLSDATRRSSIMRYHQAVINARQISAGYGYMFGINLICYLFDNYEDYKTSPMYGALRLNWTIGTGNDTSFDNNTGVVSLVGHVVTPSNVGIQRILGNNIQNAIDNGIAEYIDDPTDPDGSDSDNTYPGGGNDKNTYPEDGESGKGTFDNTNDQIDFPTLPTWDATSTGFISMWNPTMLEILDLYSFLWDSDFGTSVKKLFNEPMDAIISLAYFPVDPIISGKRNVTIGHVDSEIQMNHVAKQFCEFDFGSSQLDEYYGAAWDYSPYTRCSIYLPYIGVQPLNIDDVMKSELHLKYHIDLLTGSCVAMLKSTRNRDGLNGVTYTWTGNCGMQVPITSGSAKEFITSMIQASAIAGLAMVNPCAGALTAGYAASHEASPEVQSTGGGQWVNPTMGAFAALNVIGQKVDIQRGSKVEANAGVISPQCAYLIIERPVSAIPKGWNEYAGYPSLKIKALSTQKGLTQVAYIKLNDLEATAAEISELDSILKGGVYL